MASPHPRPASVRSVPLDRWEGCTATELAGVWQVPAVHLYAAVGSTNDVARDLGEGGAPKGTIVLAEEQVAGRGRAGRSWSSPPGLGLWLSIIHRPMAAEEPGLVPIRVALATASALDQWCEGERVGIKWPNDLLLQNRKMGGILCEGSWEDGELKHVVVGVGLNLLHAQEDFPDEIRAIATSLRTHTARPIARFEVALQIVRTLRPVLDGAAETDSLPANLEGRDVLRGRRVQVLESETGTVMAEGFAAGVAPDGALRLNTSAGMIDIRSGTVRLAGTAS